MPLQPTGDLRFDLCEIVYRFAKGATFSLDDMLDETRATLDDFRLFAAEHAQELQSRKNCFEFWNPYSDMGKLTGLPPCYDRFYTDAQGELKRPAPPPGAPYPESDYFLDPAKIQACLAMRRVALMPMDHPNAQEAHAIDCQLLRELLEVCGDIPCYTGENTLEYMRRCASIEEKCLLEAIARGDPDCYWERKLQNHHSDMAVLRGAFSIAQAACLQSACLEPSGAPAARPRI